MKILTQDPKSYLSPSTNEASRFGNSAQSTTREQLKKIPHGIVIFGLADDTGVKNVGGRIGAAEGPAAVRNKLYKFHARALPFPVYDLGDLLPENDILETHRKAADCITEIHQSGHLPVILGGGHDLAFPEALALLNAFPKQRPGFLNLDAHLDLRDTAKGITSGSPWYLLTQAEAFRKQKAALVEFGIQEHCNSHALVDYAKKQAIKILWLKDMQKKPGQLLASFAKELEALGKRKLVQVSLDIDGVRASESPASSAPQVFGFSAEEALEMCRQSGKHPAVRSFGIYEFSPPFDVDGHSAQLVAHCILSFFYGVAERKSKMKLG